MPEIRGRKTLRFNHERREMDDLKSWLAIALILVGMIVGISVLANLNGVGAKLFVSSDRAVRALTDQGFSDVQITGDSWLFVGWQGCDSGDGIKWDATAINPAGKRVNVFVCSGIFKGATIRTR